MNNCAERLALLLEMIAFSAGDGKMHESELWMSYC